MKKINLECEQCSDISTCFQAVEDLPWQQSNLGEYRQLSLWKSTPTLKPSCDRTSQEYQFTLISETISLIMESLTLLPADSPALVQVTQELERVLNIQPQLCGKKVLELSRRRNPNSWWLNNQQEFSNEDYELFLEDSEWQDIKAKLKQSRRVSLERDTKDSDYLSFPTLTSNENSTTRPAGQTKCERWFRSKGLIPNGSQLGSQAIAMIMGFPPNWFDPLGARSQSEETSEGSHRSLSPTEPQEESEVDTSQGELLHQDKQRSPSAESSISTRLRHPNSVRMLETTTVLPTEPAVTVVLRRSNLLLGGKDNSPLSTESSSSPSQELSIPCLVKQREQPEVKGVIKKDEGDRFLVEVDGEEVSVSKLFVYPDRERRSLASPADLLRRYAGETPASAVRFARQTKGLPACTSDFSTVGQIEKNPRKNITTSKNKTRKLRRGKGQGNGTIYYRAVTKNGKEYQEAYYHYTENGKKRTKYIPKKLLDQVKEAESRKKPVADILVLLVGKDKNPRKSYDTKSDRPNDSGSEKVMDTSVISPRKYLPTSKTRRTKGKGSGWIQCKPIERSGKEYQQYWYHYEEWREGDRTSKKCRYIPKRLVARVEKLNAEKVPVEEILKVLGSQNKTI